MHKDGRSHTDLKMSNILVANVDEPDNLQVVIIDVGGSMVQGTCESHDLLPVHDLRTVHQTYVHFAP